jgi:uncharacterized protein DUF2382
MQNLSMFPGISEREETELGPADVHVLKAVQEREAEPLIEEHVDVEHVLKNERVDGPLPVREEGDTVIVPVVRQVLRVEKDWVLVEEIHLKRRREERSAADVLALEENGQVMHGPAPRERGILGGRLPIFKGKLAS